MNNINVTIEYNRSLCANETYFVCIESLSVYICAFILGTLNVFTNGFFFILLFISRKNLNWKRYAHVANLTVSDFVLNLVLIGFTFFCKTSMNRYMFKHLMIWAAKLNLFSYCSSICIQCYAARLPLLYKTYLNIHKMKLSIAIIWCISLLYALLKICLYFSSVTYNFVFSIYDVVVQGFLACFNTVSYLYLFYISKQQVCEKLCPSENIGLRKNFKRLKCNTVERNVAVKEYNFVITIGITMLIYWITTLPFWIYLIVIEVTVTSYYLIDNTTQQFLLLIFLSRCVFDPLLHMYREPKFLRNFKRLTMVS